MARIKILSSNGFPVVGVGASSGGLDSFKKLLQAIPENSGMAFVLVQHLNNGHGSLLPELLQKVTNIPVLEISDDIKIVPDHIYLIPGNKMLMANDGLLQLGPRPAPNKNRPNLPIDLLFAALAEVHQTHSIGVVLSGTTSDGTLGLKAIKDHGGITFAQGEGSAEFEDMPHNAVQAGVVDFILPLEKIPEKLLEVTNIINRNGADVAEKVSGRKKNTENQELRGKELEEKVQQRTLDLREANQSLQQKIQELANKNKELESFAYITSHDLQEPLRKIQTFATRILEAEYAALSDKGKIYFERMNDSAKRMQTLIQDLFAYSRINIAEHKFEKTDLNKIIEEVKEDLKETIEEKKATIETNELCEANIDAFQFRQLMSNLINNSLKFSSPERPPHIIIKSEITKGSKLQNENPALPFFATDSFGAGKFSSEKNYCHITVSDNGIGFQPQYKEQIFEVFQRLYGKDEYPGTGIGLAIVKKIVENHHGIIVATGELNKGATFDIYFPDT